MKLEMNDFIEKNKVIAICRGTYGEKLINLVSALNDGGVKLVEVTFDQGDPECLTKTPKVSPRWLRSLEMKLKLERVLFCPLNKLKPLTKQEQNILSRLIRIQVLSNEQKN